MATALAAVLRETGGDLQLEEIELNEPGPGQVRVQLAATGVCHSDLSLATGVLPHPVPVVLATKALAGWWKWAPGSPSSNRVTRWCSTGLLRAGSAGTASTRSRTCARSPEKRPSKRLTPSSATGPRCTRDWAPRRSRPRRWSVRTPASAWPTTCRWRRWHCWVARCSPGPARSSTPPGCAPGRASWCSGSAASLSAVQAADRRGRADHRGGPGRGRQIAQRLWATDFLEASSDVAKQVEVH